VKNIPETCNMGLGISENWNVKLGGGGHSIIMRKSHHITYLLFWLLLLLFSSHWANAYLKRNWN